MVPCGRPRLASSHTYILDKPLLLLETATLCQIFCDFMLYPKVLYKSSIGSEDNGASICRLERVYCCRVRSGEQTEAGEDQRSKSLFSLIYAMHCSWLWTIFFTLSLLMFPFIVCVTQKKIHNSLAWLVLAWLCGFDTVNIFFNPCFSWWLVPPYISASHMGPQKIAGLYEPQKIHGLVRAQNSGQVQRLPVQSGFLQALEHFRLIGLWIFSCV